MSKAPIDAPEFQLDPLALSTETTGRFRMLVVAALVMAWSLPAAWVPTDPFLSIASLNSEKPILPDLGKKTIEVSDFDFRAFLEALVANPEAMRELNRQFLQFLLSIVVVASFVLTSILLFRVAGRWRLRSLGAMPLDSITSPRLVSELDGLARTAGLARSPKWFWKPGHHDGLACGTARDPLLLLTGDPRHLERGLTGQHRAVVLHELGHVANGDSATRGGAWAAWLALALLAALSPIAAWSFATPPSSFARLAVRLAASSLVGLGIWAGLVRAREHFADWRVVRWGYGAALRRRLKLASVANSDAEGDRPSGPAAWLLGLRRGFHPSNHERQRILEESAPLFRVSPFLALLTGILLSLAVGNLGLAFFQLHAAGISAVMTAFLTLGPMSTSVLGVSLLALGTGVLLPLTYWVVSALGTQMLREAIIELAEKRPRWGYSRLGRPAFGFVIGAELGFWLTPLGIGGWKEPLWMLGWLGVFTALVWVWMAQAHAVGRLVVGALSASSEPRRVEFRLRVLLTLLLLPVFWQALVARVAIAGAAAAERSTATQILGSPPAEVVHFLHITIGLLLMVGLTVTGLAGIAAFLAVGSWLRRRKPVCGRCGHRLERWRVVGAMCPGCDRPAACWLYLEPPDKTVLAAPSAVVGGAR